MKKFLKRAGLMLLAIIGVVDVANASWRVPAPSGEPVLIAHRGVHQTFHREGLENDTCTAERIYPPPPSFSKTRSPR